MIRQIFVLLHDKRNIYHIMNEALSRIRKPIEDDLARYRDLFLQSLSHDNPLLDYALKHLAKRTGKMMRPILGILAAHAFGQADDKVLHAMVSLELLHTASLVHDDVLDQSDQRRGQQSVNALMNNTQAVLVGDYLLSRALEHAALTGDVRVVHAVARLGNLLADGELLQIYNTSLTEVEEESYYKVIERKTASLFSTVAYVGSLLAGAPSEHIDKLHNFGRILGLCFQIRDDIFDYNPTADLGKPSGIDMKEGKLTLPIIAAVMKPGNDAERALALKVRAGEATDQDVAFLTQFAIQQGGVDYAYQAMERLSQQALLELDFLPETPVKDSLIEYLNFVAQRDL